MSEDIASLVLKIDAAQADVAATSLDKVTAAGAKAEAAVTSLGGAGKASLGGLSAIPASLQQIEARTDALRSSVDPLYAAQKRLNTQMAEADNLFKSGALGAAEYQRTIGILDNQLNAVSMAQDKLNAAHVKSAAGSKLASHEAANLGRQFADIGTSLAGGASPFMVLIQQGPQIADIMHTSGLSAKGLAKEVGLMLGILRAVPAANAAVAVSTAAVVAGNEAIATSATAAAAAEAVALAPLAIVLAGIALTLATLGVGFAVTAQQIDKTGHSAKDLQAKLGLTEEQMKRLKKEGHEVGVTFGDVLVGTFDFAGKKLAEAFKWNDMKKAVGGFYQTAVDWTVTSIRSMVGAWAGFQGGLRAMFTAMPAVIGEAAIGAANMAIRAVNWLIENGRDKLNDLIKIANMVAALTLNPIRIPEIPDGKIAEMKNQYAGAGAKLGSAYSDGFKEASDAAMSQFDKDVAGWLGAIDAAWLKRNKKAAGDPGKEAKGATEKDPFGDLMKQVAAQAVATDAATVAQNAWNDAVASGTMTVEEANRARDWAIERAGIEAKADTFSAEQKAVLGKALDALAISYDKAAAAKAAGEQIGANRQAMADQARTLEFLGAQIRLIGAGNVEREVELAQLREKQAILNGKGPGYVLTESDNNRISGAGDVAASQAALAIGQDLYNKSLDYTYDRLTQIDDLVSNSTAGLADAFDGMSDGAAKFTRALGGVLGAVNKLAIAEEKANQARINGWKRVNDVAATGDIGAIIQAINVGMSEQADSARQLADAQVGAYANMANAAKGFFEEGSAGYETLQAAEIAFRAVQFALSVQAMAQSAAETTTGLAQSASKAVASTIAGAAKAFEQMGIWGFVGAGAIIAFMAAVGVNAGGGGGGAAYDLEGVQSRQGTGSVLGSTDAKSESIAKSLELVADHTNDMLEYNNGMLRALRNIDINIGNLASSLARSLNLSGITDVQSTSYNPITGRDASGEINKVLLGAGGAADLGKLAKAFSQPFGSGNILRDIFNPGPIDPLGLFDSKISKKLVDAGVTFTAQSLGSILTEGLKASYFQVMRTTREDKAFGFVYNTSTKEKTATTGLDADLQRQFSLVIGSLREGVLSAASVLGVDGAQAVLDAFKINIGKISFKDMDGAEITATLEAVFSKVGDDMAGAVIPGLSEFQKAGEGLFETLIRVARQYQVIDVTLASVGLTFGAVGLSSLAARERLVDLFGSLDDFTDQVSFYSENFLTEAERLAPVQAALTTELARLGITGLDTRDEFKALVQGLDLSSAAGAELFAALMAIAPAFAAITEETQAIADQRDRLSTAYERESSALADTKAQFQDLFKSLGSFKSSLYTGPSAALSPEAQYNASKGEFERIRGLALTGDVNALGDLQSVSQEYLDASRAYFASSQGYFADLEAVRSAVTAAEGIAGAQVDVAQQQLDALLNLVDPILNIRDDIGTVAAEMQRLNQLLGATTTNTPVVVGGISAGAVANDNTQVVTAIEQTNANLNTLIETTNAAMSQQAAIHNENMVAQQQQITVLQRQVQEMQENRA